METAEERGREFLNFVGENESRLRWNLAKNVSYDPDLFEDVFSYTVLRVYESIIKRGLHIKDYEQYFFTASRLNYIKTDERTRRRRAMLTRIEESPDRPEAEYVRRVPSIPQLVKELESLFGEEDTGIFMRFMKLKSQGRISYEEFARREGLQATRVAKLCGRIKRYLKH